MIKTYKLPRKFAETWFEFLLSGEFKQSGGVLVEFHEDDSENNPLEPHGYCCLGVAGKVCGISNDDLDDALLYPQMRSLGTMDIPEMLITEDNDSAHQYNFSNVLSCFNDGLTLKTLKNIQKANPNLVFTKRVMDFCKKSHAEDSIENIKFNFKQIVQFIKKNTELYDL